MTLKKQEKHTFKVQQKRGLTKYSSFMLNYDEMMKKTKKKHTHNVKK